MSTDSQKLLTRKQAAEYLGVTYWTLSSWHSQNKYNIPVVKIGGRARYRKSDLDAWIESRTVTNTSQKLT